MNKKRRVIIEKIDQFLIMELYIPGSDLSSYKGFPFQDDFYIPDTMFVAAREPIDGLTDVRDIIGYAKIIRRKNKYYAERLTQLNPERKELLDRIYDREAEICIIGMGNKSKDGLVFGFRPNILYINL